MSKGYEWMMVWEMEVFIMVVMSQFQDELLSSNKMAMNLNKKGSKNGMIYNK